jgi:hypothetical protein
MKRKINGPEKQAGQVLRWNIQQNNFHHPHGQASCARGEESCHVSVLKLYDCHVAGSPTNRFRRQGCHFTGLQIDLEGFADEKESADFRTVHLGV